jgi:hypothetical protein
VEEKEYLNGHLQHGKGENRCQQRIARDGFSNNQIVWYGCKNKG